MQHCSFLAFGLCSAFFAGLRSIHALRDSSAQLHRVLLLNRHAQEMDEEPASGGMRPLADAVGLIRLDVAVRDNKGNLVSGLPVSDFTLLENDKSNKILSFQAIEGGGERGVPAAEVVLLLDTVGLSNVQSSLQEREVRRFLQQKGGRLAHPVSLFWLEESGLRSPVQAQPSVDGNGLAAALEHKGKLHSVWSRV